MANSLIVGEATAVGENRQSRPQVKKKSTQQKAKELIKKANAARASLMMLWIPGGIWCVQFLFWAVGMVSIGLEDIPGVNILYPGETLFKFSYFIIVILGILTLIYVAALYIAQRINCFGGMKLIVFCICFSLYLFPVLNLFPWFGLWMCSVIYLQDED